MKTFILNTIIITATTGVFLAPSSATNMYVHKAEFVERNTDRATYLEYLDACAVHDTIIARTRGVIHADARLRGEVAGAKVPYTNNVGSAPKSVGMNDAAWVCDFNRPYGHKKAIGGEHNLLIVEVFESPVHGWPTSSGMTFDDHEDRKEQSIAESRGQMEIDPVKLYHMSQDEYFMPSNSKLQATALAKLARICIERGLRPSDFTQQQLHKFVLDYMDKHNAAQYGIKNVSEQASTGNTYDRFMKGA